MILELTIDFFGQTMIKAVCFDLHNTLAYYDPPRAEVHAWACHECGIPVNSEAIRQSLPEADAFWVKEDSGSPVDKRPDKERFALYAEYEAKLIKGAGFGVAPEIASQVLVKARQSLRFRLYDDALPTLKLLKDRGLKLGLISNVSEDILSIIKDLGLEPYLDFQVTSLEVGVDKPHPDIFRAALRKAGSVAEETTYIGDQYDSDVVGAWGVGMKAVLLDRSDSFVRISGCPRIHSLTEIPDYI